jgi:hypothetical protein
VHLVRAVAATAGRRLVVRHDRIRPDIIINNNKTFRNAWLLTSSGCLHVRLLNLFGQNQPLYTMRY